MADSKVEDQAAADDVVTIDRRRSDRRDDVGDDGVTASEGNTSRRKKQRRRHIDPTTCERDYNNDEIEFMRAMDDYKRDAGRMFPTCSEVLEVIRKLGYVKLTEEQLADLQVAEFDDAADFDLDVDDDEAELEDE